MAFIIWFVIIMAHFPYLILWTKDGKPLFAYRARWKTLLSRR